MKNVKIKKIAYHLDQAKQELNNLIGYLDAENDLSINNDNNNNFPLVNRILDFEKGSDIDMFGSITKRKDGRYMGRFYFNNQIFTVYAKTKNECLIKLKEKRKELFNSFTNSLKQKQAFKDNNQSFSLNQDMTLNEWFDYYYDNFKKQQIKLSTYLKNVEIYERYTRHVIGDLPVEYFTSSYLQSFLNDIAVPSGRKKTKSILNELFRLLQSQGILYNNPMALVVLTKENKDLPINNKVKEDEKFLTYQEELKLLDYLKNNGDKFIYYFAVKFALYTGLRRGELIGLSWDCIDFEKNEINVYKQYNITTNLISSVKSKKAERVIPLLKTAKDTLHELKQHPKYKAIDDYIFPNIYGITQKLCRCSNVLGFKCSPHVLRHTFASRLYAAKIDFKRLQNILGHESIETTLNTYTHILNYDESEVINKLTKELKELNILI